MMKPGPRAGFGALTNSLQTGRRADSPLKRFVRTLETTEALDGPSAMIDAATGSVGGYGSVLRGAWVGHAVHPLLTDFPLGCWLSAGVLDLVGGASTRKARKRLVGLGVLAAIPTLVTGSAEWSELETPGQRRLASVHAIGNLFATAAYAVSWHRRHVGRDKAGVAWAMTGGAVSILTGYIGGHLAVGLGVGHGERWGEGPARELPD